MTKKEYEELHRTAKDKLNHTIKVGDTVIATYYSNAVDVFKVVRICPKRIVVVRIGCKWEDMMNPSKVIKIKEDGIPED